jgi:3-deoxy-D-manno-octulosonic-acid transferase
VPRTIAALLQRFDLCLAQSQDDGRRYSDLGASVLITGNLKIDVPPPPADAASLSKLQGATRARTLVAAASTHAGEETAMIEAHQLLCRDDPTLLTVIAPRHPERGAAIAEMAAAAGLRPSLRSRGETPQPGNDLYILDTVGELGLLYRLAPIVFVGGSLVAHGGQNPIEAAKLGAAILHGPHVWNFAEIYAALDSAQGAMLVTDAASLASRIKVWFNQPNARDSVALAGRRTVDALGGALERTLSALEPHLQPLLGGRKAGHA